MWPYAPSTLYPLMIYLRMVGAVLCSLLAVKAKWPKSLLPYLPVFWQGTLLYCLPFINTVMLLLTQGSRVWLINVTLAVLWLMVLVDWMSCLILTVLGVGLGSLFCTQVAGTMPLSFDFSTGYLLVYQVVFATLIGLLFARRKQQRFDTLTQQSKQMTRKHTTTKQTLLSTVQERTKFIDLFQRSGAHVLQGLVGLSKKVLVQTQSLGLPQEVRKTMTQLHNQLKPIAVHLHKLDQHALSYLPLSTTTLPLDKLLAVVQTKLAEQGLGKHLHWQKRTQHKMLECDVERIAPCYGSMGLAF